jgi:acetyltransferase-like isoleucine patch superfamily enzyme
MPYSAAVTGLGESKRRTRRLLVVGLLRLRARALGARLTIDVAKDVEFGRRVRFAVQRGCRATVHIGAGSRILDDVEILIWGGSLDLGERCEIRRGTVITLSGGHLVLEEANKLSYNNVVHCASAVTLLRFASTAEGVSIVDSTHHHDGAHAAFYENTTSAPILIGRNAWLCNKASVLMGVTVGHNAVVASHALVREDVPDGMVVGGVPARILGPRQVAGPALGLYDNGAARR